MPKTTFPAININEDSRLNDFYERFNEIKDKPFPARQTCRDYFDSYKLTRGQRFYISDKKYYIIEQVSYEKCGKTIKLDDYLGVELIDLSTKDRTYLDVALLCKKFLAYKNDDDWRNRNDKECITVMSKSDINQYVYKVTKDIKPYITIKEFADVFINYVGNRQIYFQLNTYHRPGRAKIDCILHAHFVKNINSYY